MDVHTRVVFLISIGAHRFELARCALSGRMGIYALQERKDSRPAYRRSSAPRQFFRQPNFENVDVE
jgi:hypothetical protein